MIDENMNPEELKVVMLYGLRLRYPALCNQWSKDVQANISRQEETTLSRNRKTKDVIEDNDTQMLVQAAAVHWVANRVHTEFP